jgi:hypothetical protein
MVSITLLCRQSSGRGPLLADDARRATVPAALDVTSHCSTVDLFTVLATT